MNQVNMKAYAQVLGRINKINVYGDLIRLKDRVNQLVHNVNANASLHKAITAQMSIVAKRVSNTKNLTLTAIR